MKTETNRDISAKNLLKEMETLYIRNINSITDSSFFELNEVSLKSFSEYVFVSLKGDYNFVFDKNNSYYSFGLPVRINETLSNNQVNLII